MQSTISLSTLKLHNERLNDLIKELEDNFSYPTPNPNDSIETIMFRAGQATVVEWIKRKLDED
jgi:hypothetical protein